MIDNNGRYSGLFQNSPLMVCISDIHGQIEFSNAALSEKCGFEAQELVGKYILNFSCSIRSESDPIWDTIVNDGFWHGTVENRTKEGIPYEESVWASMMTDNQGEPAGCLRISLEKKTTLDGIFKHDLRQPVSSILGNAECGLLLLQNDPVDLKEMEDIFNDIIHENQRIVKMIKKS